MSGPLHDPLAHALRRLGELEESPRGIVGSRASLVALYDSLMAALDRPDGEVATSRIALSLACSGLTAFGLAAQVDDDVEVRRLLKIGRGYLVAAVEAERIGAAS